jgi:hypothetical protein
MNHSQPTPYVVGVYAPDYLATHYCLAPADVLTTVREYGEQPTDDQITQLLSCSNGNGVTIGGHEFSVEREW